LIKHTGNGKRNDGDRKAQILRKNVCGLFSSLPWWPHPPPSPAADYPNRPVPLADRFAPRRPGHIVRAHHAQWLSEHFGSHSCGEPRRLRRQFAHRGRAIGSNPDVYTLLYIGANTRSRPASTRHCRSTSSATPCRLKLHQVPQHSGGREQRSFQNGPLV